MKPTHWVLCKINPHTKADGETFFARINYDTMTVEITVWGKGIPVEEIAIVVCPYGGRTNFVSDTDYEEAIFREICSLYIDADYVACWDLFTDGSKVFREKRF